MNDGKLSPQTVSGVTPETTRGTRVPPTESNHSQPRLQLFAQNLPGPIEP